MPSIVRPMSTPVQRELRALGLRVRAARLARDLPITRLAERAMTSRHTIQRIEAGDPDVGWGTVLAALHSLGLLDSASALVPLPAGETMDAKALRNRRARPAKVKQAKANKTKEEPSSTEELGA